MNVFAYGSLVAPGVMEAVSGRRHEHVRAKLAGFARFGLIGRVYPGIVPVASAQTDGRLYFDFEERELQRLDWWEAEEYDREIVEVESTEGERFEAWTYVVAPEHRAIVGNAPWSEARFVAKELPAFLAHTREVMSDYPGDEIREGS